MHQIGCLFTAICSDVYDKRSSCESGNLGMDKAWLRAVLQRADASQADLARELDLAPSAISRILTGGRQVKATEAAHIARYLGIPIDELMKQLTGEGTFAPGSPRRRGPPPRTAAGDANEPWTLIPIRNSSSGADFLDADPIGYTRCPPNLAGVRSAYAVYVADDSMEPRYVPGWLLYVHPSKPPIRDRDVLVVKKDGRVVIGQVIRSHGDVLNLRQFNPRRSVDIAMRDALAVHLVVGVDQEG